MHKVGAEPVISSFIQKSVKKVQETDTNDLAVGEMDIIYLYRLNST